MYDQEADGIGAEEQVPTDVTASTTQPAPQDTADNADAENNELLEHPDPKKQPTKRRRKAVTPHWEDVLLGVRANTKRPRS